MIRDKILEINKEINNVLLLAITKGRTIEQINEAISAGIKAIGENKAQELKVKFPFLPKDLRIDFIGHLQTNKVRDVVKHCYLIHSVDSLYLAREVDRQAKNMGKRQNILLQINISGEKSKYGFKKEDVIDQMPQLLKLSNIRIIGLMTIAPHFDNPEKTRPIFQKLKLLKNQLEEENRVGIYELSMGMSNDYKIAIEEGATIVRLGRIIFE
jgi:pyridoxal phosphate enzyme (YggS family)